MTLEECYKMLDGDYEGVIGRLRQENRVKKFALKFLNDPSYDALMKSLASLDYKEAFRAAHTIKGVCQNLGFQKLYESSHILTEALRNEHFENIDDYFSQVKKDYQLTINALEKLKEESIS